MLGVLHLLFISFISFYVALLMAISLFIYIGKYEETVTDAFKDITKYSYSFGLGWAAVVIYIISAAIYGVRAFIILRTRNE